MWNSFKSQRLINLVTYICRCSERPALNLYVQTQLTRIQHSVCFVTYYHFVEISYMYRRTSIRGLKFRLMSTVQYRAISTWRA